MSKHSEMETLLILIGVFVGYLLVYKFYGHFLAKLFALSDSNPVPSKEFEDGVDYVPTRKEIIFGHHFASIAGTGPIVGPAIAIIWGWLPALIWVFIGSIIMGAVQDFGSLVISLRNKGKSISEYTAKYISTRTKFAFFIIVFLEIWIVIAIFGLVIALIFNIFPNSVWPVWLQIVIAVGLGIAIKRGANVTVSTIVAVVLLYLSIYLGVVAPFKMPTVLGIPSTGVWTIILLIYAYIASVLPVTALLQPRDYINAYQLLIAMTLMVIGVIVASLKGMQIVAPMVNAHPAQAPPMVPFLFITIACGAISGFHSLVSSGTTAKQLAKETDAVFVGYGAMLTEGALATLVIIAVSAGIGLGYMKDGHLLTGVQAWTAHYSSWAAAKGLGSKLTAFVTGAANMMETAGIPKNYALVLMGVFVASFAGTTLDTATRIQRYITTEIFSSLKVYAFENKHLATSFAVITAGLLAFSTGADGKGALTLWPMFGAVNQTLAALALTVITVYLRIKGGWKWIIAGIPAIFMIVVTFWASIMNEINYIKSHNALLYIVNLIIILLVIFIVFEGTVKFFQVSKNEKAA